MKIHIKTALSNKFDMHVAILLIKKQTKENKTFLSCSIMKKIKK